MLSLILSAFIINSFTFGGGGSSDPYFANVRLLMHMNTASFPDTSGTPATITVNSTTVDTTLKQFGAGAAKCYDSGEVLSAADDGRFQITTGDWTWEMWVAIDPISLGFLAGRRIVDTQFLRLRGVTETTFAADISFNNQGSRVSLGTTGALTPGTWYHVAVTRSGSTFTFWLDGVSQGTYTSAAAHAGGSYAAAIGGYAGTNNQSRCYIDEVRFTAGVARYTSTFTPPTAAFPDS